MSMPICKGEKSPEAAALLGERGAAQLTLARDSLPPRRLQAIKCGYRHLDCACDYGNEGEVGAGIKQAIDEGLVKRADLWVTSKLWNTYVPPPLDHRDAARWRGLLRAGHRLPCAQPFTPPAGTRLARR